MSPRLYRSWELVKASASVLRSDKQLLVYPLISAIAWFLVTIAFLVPVILYALSRHLFTSSAQSAQISAELHRSPSYLYMFLFYLCQYSVAFFANCALVGAALVRLRGGKPTVVTGYRMALRHCGAILGYAALAATIGVVMRRISERSGTLGHIGIGLVSTAWNVATYLVAPILIMEKASPTEAIKRSEGLLKRTWGEQLIGNVGLEIVFSLILLLMLLLFLPPLIWAASHESYAWIITVSMLLVLALSLLLLIQAALSGIYRAALYLYASEGFTGGPFNAKQMREAFRTK